MRPLPLLLLSQLILLSGCSHLQSFKIPGQENRSTANSTIANKTAPLPTLSHESASFYASSTPADTPSSSRIVLSNRGKVPDIATTHNTPAPSAIKSRPKQDNIHLDYEQVDIQVVFEEIADTLGISLLIDPSINKKVILRTATDRPLTTDSLWPLFQTLLEQHNITLDKHGNLYQLRQAKQSTIQNIRSNHSLEHNPEQPSPPVTTQITLLKHISTKSAIDVIQALVLPEGKVVTLPNLNSLAITSSPSRIKQVNHILSIIDANPFIHMGTHLYNLHHAQAKDVAKDLSKIVQTIEGKESPVTILPLDRINAILAVTPPEYRIREITQWVDILDSKEGESNEQVFIYKVKNLDATNLAHTLQQAYSRPSTQNNTISLPIQKNSKTKKSKTAPILRKKQGSTANLEITITADKGTNSLLIRTSPRDYQHLLQTIYALDTVPKEVMINILIAEVSLSGQHEYGIDWEHLTASRGSWGFQSIADIPHGGLLSFANGALGIEKKGGNFTAILKLLQSNTKLTVLSRPSLLVRNNQEASINVGTEEPVISNSRQSSVTASGTTYDYDVQYRNTGIILNVIPHINDDGMINIDIDQEVSKVGATRTFGNGTSSNSEYPSFTTRHVKTSAVVKDGNAIILGGIMESESSDNNDGIPQLMEIPLIGSLFSNNTEQSAHKELVIIIVPEIISPESNNQIYNTLFIKRMQSLREALQVPPHQEVFDILKQHNPI